MQSFIQVYDLIMKKEGDKSNYIKEYIKILLEESEKWKEIENCQSKYEKLIPLLKKEYSFVKTNLGKMQEYPKLMISIF